MPVGIDSCCRCLNPGCPPPPPPANCMDCFAISSPIITYDVSVGPCNEAFSVIFQSTPNCSSVVYEVVGNNPGFTNLSFTGNTLTGQTDPAYAIPNVGKVLTILVRGTCMAGASAGFSAKGIVQIPIIDRCLGKNCYKCDPCTGLCGPQEIEILQNTEIQVIP